MSSIFRAEKPLKLELFVRRPVTRSKAEWSEALMLL